MEWRTNWGICSVYFFPLLLCYLHIPPGCVLVLDFKKVPVVLGIHQFAEDLNLELLSRIPSAKYNKAWKFNMF